MDFLAYDFGYAWPWTYGHLIPVALFGLLLLIGWWRKWRTWAMVLLSLPTIWGLVGLWIVHGELNFTRPVKLPTEQFLEAGSGVVLDAGAGSGRSSLMVLLARPQSRVIALDIFSDEFGIEANTPERLQRNAERAGVADRIEIKTGDMRKLPLRADSLDGAVSAYAIDHLSEEGIAQALAELDRTIKSGGDLLILTINADRYIRIAYPMLAEHGYFGQKDANLLWTRRLRDAGFKIVEIGTTPGTMYFLARAR
jgi:ubiquinone/menaquinone biosynthesis C-methylase UbiE